MNTTALTTLTTKQKINSILSLPKITPNDIEGLSIPERDRLANAATKALAKLKGEQRDRYIDKIETIIAPQTKNSFWEHNHNLISSAISNFMRNYGSMPTMSVLAEETGFSRQTIAKHIKEYKSHPSFIAQIEQFKFMSHSILANVFKYAGNGDMRAARLYFEMVGTINKPQTNTVVTAHNYIQINNTILSQENLKQLSTEQLNQIENIVKNEQCKLMAI